MKDAVYPHTNRVSVVQVPLKFFLKIIIPYLGEDLKIRCLRFHGYLVVVVTEYKGGIGKEPAVENMVPSEGTGAVPPVYPKLVLVPEFIPSKVSGNKKPVVFSQLEVQLGIQIIKIQLAVLNRSVFSE